MPKFLKTLLKHPRGTVFAAFNLAMALAAVQFGALVIAGSEAGMGGFAEIAIGYTGIALAGLALAAGWAMWTGAALYRHRDELLTHHGAPALCHIGTGRRR